MYDSFSIFHLGMPCIAYNITDAFKIPSSPCRRGFVYTQIQMINIYNKINNIVCCVCLKYTFCQCNLCHFFPFFANNLKYWARYYFRLKSKSNNSGLVIDFRNWYFRIDCFPWYNNVTTVFSHGKLKINCILYNFNGKLIEFLLL